MIICHCHRRTDRDIEHEGPRGPAGSACGGCKPAVDAVLEKRVVCAYCDHYPPTGLLLGNPACESCG